VHTDLRDLLPVAEAEAPPLRHSAGDVLAAARRHRARRRATTASLATAVLVAAALVVPRVFTDRPPEPPAPVAPPPTAAFTYPAGPLTGNIPRYAAGPLTVSGTVRVTPAFQVAEITDGVHRDDRGGLVPVALLTVFKPGSLDPSAYLSGESLTINGRPGKYVPAIPYDNRSSPEPAVIWEYDEDAYAVVTDRGVPQPITRAEMIAVAEALRPGAEQPVRVGFRLSYVPADFTLGTAGAFTGESSLYLVPGTYPRTLRNADDPLRRSMIRLRLHPANEAKGRSSGTYCPSTGLCYRATPDRRYVLGVVGTGAQTDAELRKILDRATIAVPDDPATWYPAADALP
jgi:hypothetical protein